MPRLMVHLCVLLISVTFSAAFREPDAGGTKPVEPSKIDPLLATVQSASRQATQFLQDRSGEDPEDSAAEEVLQSLNDNSASATTAPATTADQPDEPNWLSSERTHLTNIAAELENMASLYASCVDHADQCESCASALESIQQEATEAGTDAEHVEPGHKADFITMRNEFSDTLDELDLILQQCKNERNCVAAASFGSKVVNILSEYRDKLLAVQPAALDSTFQEELLQRRMAGAALLQSVSSVLVLSVPRGDGTCGNLVPGKGLVRSNHPTPGCRNKVICADGDGGFCACDNGNGACSHCDDCGWGQGKWGCSFACDKAKTKYFGRRRRWWGRRLLSVEAGGMNISADLKADDKEEDELDLLSDEVRVQANVGWDCH